LARLIARSGSWTVIAVALALVTSGAVVAALALKLPPVALAIALALSAGLWIAAVVLLGLYVYGAEPPTGGGRSWSSYRTMVAAFLFATIVSNVVSTSYMAATGKLAGLAQGQLTLSPDVLVIALLPLQACLALFLHYRLVRSAALSWAAMGFTWSRLGRQVAMGLPLGLGMLALLALSSLGLRAIGVEQTQATMFSGLKGAPLASFIAFFLASAVIAPIVEEAYFRGYVLRACLRSKGRWQAYGMSAGLFALAHANLPALVPFLLFSIVMAYVVERTRTIGPSVVAHAVNNGAVAAALFLVGGSG
jgi:hypothetical protein